MSNVEALEKKTDENQYQYIWRLCEAKDNGVLDMSWAELADILNHALFTDAKEYKDAASYRKPYQCAKAYLEHVFSNIALREEDAHLQALRAAKEALAIERVKVRGERNAYAQLLREQAHREMLIQTVRDTIVADVQPFQISYPLHPPDEDCGMIIHLTDVHAGLEINHALNKYNIEVLHDRLMLYLEKIFEISTTHSIHTCHLVLGGDLLSGLIHTNLRLENCENVIAQVKIICKTITEFVKALRGAFSSIDIFSVSGNHSRLTPNKDSHLAGEELDALVPFYLEAAFQQDDGVMIHQNQYGEYVAMFEAGGHTWCAVHGDKDTVQTVVYDLTKMIGYKPDGVLMGHRHANGMTTDGQTKIVQSGCVCGTDRYALNRRLFADPEQVVIVYDRMNTIKCLYDIQVF